MAMKEKLWDDVAVLSLKGAYMGGPESLSVHDKVHSLMENGIKRVVLDLSDVDWFNSSGLGILIACITSLRNAGGDLKLTRVPRRIKTLLRTTKLIGIFEAYDSVDKGVASFL
jgi:anti-sigma B factor antagonist